MIRRYLLTLSILVAVACSVLSAQPFVTLSHVLSGTIQEETWEHDFTLDASRDQYYEVDDEVQRALEEGITIVGSGAVVVRASSVRVTPKEVSWTSGKVRYTAKGGRMVSTVRWEARSDEVTRGAGEIRVDFPELAGVAHYSPMLHSGPHQKVDERWVVREVTGYRDAASLATGRFAFVLFDALSFSLLVHGLLWALYLRRVKRERIAALPPPPPRIHVPNPIAEWSAWTTVVCIAAGVASLLAIFAIGDGYQSSVLWWVNVVALAIGLVVALVTVAIVRATVITVRIDDDGLAYAKGRGEPQWLTVPWSELRDARVMSRTYRGTTTEWIELVFPDGKKRKIPESLTDYPALRETVLERFHGAREAG